MSPPCLQCGHLCVTQGKAALGPHWGLQLECLWVMGPQQHRACCNLKNPSEIQWDLVQVMWIKTALGLPHPQSPIYCSISISEVITSSFSFFFEDPKWWYFPSVAFFPGHSHYSRLTGATLLKLNLSSSSSHHWFLVCVFQSNQKPHCTLHAADEMSLTIAS